MPKPDYLEPIENLLDPNVEFQEQEWNQAVKDWAISAEEDEEPHDEWFSTQEKTEKLKPIIILKYDIYKLKLEIKKIKEKIRKKEDRLIVEYYLLEHPDSTVNSDHYYSWLLTKFG